MEDIPIFPPYFVVNSGFVLFLTVLVIMLVLAKVFMMIRALPATRRSEIELCPC